MYRHSQEPAPKRRRTSRLSDDVAHMPVKQEPGAEGRNQNLDVFESRCRWLMAMYIQWHQRYIHTYICIYVHIYIRYIQKKICIYICI
jgi:hypothetical protein